MIIHFILERETKGAVRYMETVDSVSDVPKDLASGAVIGTLYIRNTALNGKVPLRLEVEVKLYLHRPSGRLCLMDGDCVRLRAITACASTRFDSVTGHLR